MILRIEDITVNQSINLREVDMVTVAEYSEAMRNGGKFPPVKGVYDDCDWILYSGFHRIEAAKRIGLGEIEADVTTGVWLDAEKLACAENAEHGKPRSNLEKRDAVNRVLKLEPDWSDRQIAKWCKVDHKTVGRMRNLTGEFPSEERERTYTTKHGTTATMKTGNIGAKTDQLVEVNFAESVIENPRKYVESEPQVMMRYNDEPIRNEADLIRAVDKMPLMRQVTQWDHFTTQVSKAHITLVELIDGFGLESVSDMLREEEMASDMLKIRHFWAKIEEVLTSLEERL